MEATAIYSSKNVNKDFTIYSHEDERYIKEERLQAQIMIANRNQRLKIRDYNNQFNSSSLKTI